MESAARPRFVQRKARPAAQRRLIAATLVAIHVAAVVGLVMGPGPSDWILMASVYFIQVVGLGVGLHRYFAHRSYRTSRPFQFVLALCAAASFGNPIGFSGKHRLHHRHVDCEVDVHTPLHGWWACWFGSLLDSGYSDEEILRQVPDLRRYPELVWFHENSRTVGLSMVALAFAFGGVTAVGVGICLPTVLVLHATSAVNYFAHKYGTRRFETDDLSTNNAIVALLSFGEGWHNNHHRYPHSARHGFAWWEIDMTYWVICALEAVGLVWGVRRPPATATEDPTPRAEATTA